MAEFLICGEISFRAIVTDKNKKQAANKLIRHLELTNNYHPNDPKKAGVKLSQYGVEKDDLVIEKLNKWTCSHCHAILASRSSLARHMKRFGDHRELGGFTEEEMQNSTENI